MGRQALKEFAVRTAAVLFGVVLTAAALEIVLRFLPVYGGAHRLPVNERCPIVRMEPDRTFIWSKGWNFALANPVSTNNYGFVSEIDYDASGATPLISIVGDSYVEAMMVPFEATVGARLAEHLGDTVRVYTFAVSGAPLSQYLAYAEFAREEFRHDGLIAVVVGNDFDESLAKYSRKPGLHTFVDGEGGDLVLKRLDFSVPLSKRVIRRSALFRYLVANLSVGRLRERVRHRLSSRDETARFVGNVAAEVGATRVADAKRAVDAFLDELPARSGLDPSRILLVVDGMRPHLYDDEQLAAARGSYFDVLRRYFIDAAEARGYGVIDMQVVFLEDHRARGERFEFAADSHWNGNGHAVVSRAVLESGFVNRIVRARGRDGGS